MNITTTEKIKDLQYICEHRMFDLLKISEDDYNTKLALPGKHLWNQKETLGYLVDLAVFQHQRMVKAQCEAVPEIIHEPDTWLKCGHYEKMNSRKLLLFWKNYNLFIIDLIQNMSPAELAKRSRINPMVSMSVEDLFVEYADKVNEHSLHILNARLYMLSGIN